MHYVCCLDYSAHCAMWQTPACSICVCCNSTASYSNTTKFFLFSFPFYIFHFFFFLNKTRMTCSGGEEGHAPNEHTHLIPSSKRQDSNHKSIPISTSSCINLASKVDDLTQSSTKKKLAIATTIALLFFATELIAGYLANSLGKKGTL